MLEYIYLENFDTVTVGENEGLNLPLEDLKDKYLNQEFLQI